MAVPATGLVRSIGRWTLVGLVLNGVLGSGIFGLPSTLIGKLGPASLWAWPIGAGLVGIIMLCFAEVASRFRDAGGPYLYARVAFGDFAGIQMGWVAYLVRLTSAASNVNLFVLYLAEFWPGVRHPAAGAVVLISLLAFFAVINYRGADLGARLSNVVVAAKLVPVTLFALVGLALVVARGEAAVQPVVTPTPAAWLDGIVLLVFAYGGFEAGLMPLAEAKQPERDAPFALLMTLAVCTVLYILVELVVLRALPNAPSSSRPLAAAAAALIGPMGARFMAVAALLSVLGWLAAAMVNVPRLTYAMAANGDLPSIVGRVHPTYRTPHVSIVLFAVLVAALALSGSFLQNVTLAVVSRLVNYGVVCAALPALRRQERTAPDRVPPARFRLKAGPLLAALGVAITALLITRITTREALIMAAVVAGASVNYFASRSRPLKP
ncbi:MAG: APC family permease [Gemmatimonadota bacterium]